MGDEKFIYYLYKYKDGKWNYSTIMSIQNFLVPKTTKFIVLVIN